MPLSPSKIRDIFVLQSRNVREIKKHRLQLRRDLNRSCRRNDEAGLRAKTLLYALLFSAWSEAQWIQILHTPAAFSGTEIETVQARRKSQGIGAAWTLMIEIAVSRVGDPSSNDSLAQRQAIVLQAIQDHIVDPSVLRNKIAHGQWRVALNSSHTAENPELSLRLQSLDYVRIELNFRVHELLGSIIRDLMQSPAKGHHRDFWVHHTELVDLVTRSAAWSVETKREELAKKLA